MEAYDDAREMLQTGRRGLVGVLAGTAWISWGLITARAFTPLVLAALGSAAGFLLAGCGYCVIQGSRVRPTEDRSRRGLNKGLLLVLLLEGAGVGVVVFAAQKTGRLDLLPVWIGMVIGLHFFALAEVFRLPRYRFLGAAITAWCVLAWILFRGNSLTVAVGLGTGAILWSATLLFLFRVLENRIKM